jgi:hypothetical protein
MTPSPQVLQMAMVDVLKKDDVIQSWEALKWFSFLLHIRIFEPALSLLLSLFWSLCCLLTGTALFSNDGFHIGPIIEWMSSVGGKFHRLSSKDRYIMNSIYINEKSAVLELFGGSKELIVGARGRLLSWLPWHLLNLWKNELPVMLISSLRVSCRLSTL